MMITIKSPYCINLKYVMAPIQLQFSSIDAVYVVDGKIESGIQNNVTIIRFPATAIGVIRNFRFYGEQIEAHLKDLHGLSYLTARDVTDYIKRELIMAG